MLVVTASCGQLLHRVRRLRPRTHRNLRRSREYGTPRDIAIDCLGTAVTDFLAEGGALEGWNPGKGRNLTSYFLHFALRHFRDAYRRWAREQRRRLFEFIGEDTFQWYRFEQGTVAWGLFPFPGPEHQAVLREALAVILDGASREEYAVCKAMLITGATQEEIAQLLGTTRKSVERRLARVRSRAIKLAAAGVIMTPTQRTVARWPEHRRWSGVLRRTS